MNDHGHPITFGVSLDPSAENLAATRHVARTAVDGGYHLLAVQDHPYQPGYLDTWTMISHLAAETDRISFLTDVADLQLRPPTMLAKAAASLSVMTRGRVVLGVGGGASTDAIAAMGGTRRTGPQMVAYTEESLMVMRRALAGEPVRHVSDQHAIEGYAAGPLSPAPVPLWVGAQKRRMLGVVGRHADGWISPLNIYVPPVEVPSRQAIIDEAARAAGRDPARVRRIYNVIGAVGPYRGGTGLVGDVNLWVNTLTEWAVELGFDTFVFWPVSSAAAQVELFANEVVPAVRERVRAVRGRR
ncbi:LLM class flavin-dependent oxidoreductase [Micromonospora sp. WMMD1082]|uniref:LLM class flavin-dependent oxidoreductase n=1 Tax=Micromonospora sp. WMMD1082 TaxID=3016104 RepID=UPI0024176CBF|nr:LLM class flavin-dependent oxidoreductase [Micromonospora sp. WMMD1082]MDG4796107.1 LLM class flavin-dependent oxidoreductase [Micromonospora sp. WMMD1082]